MKPLSQLFSKHQLYKYKTDGLLILLLGLIAGFAYFQAAQLVNPALFTEQVQDIWFDADASIVFANMVNRSSNYARNSVHPLFPMGGYLLVWPFRVVLGMTPIMAVRGALAVLVAIWVGTLFLLLRLIGCQRLDAVFFSILGGTSAAAIFWFVVPETYSLGSLSILLALCLATVAQSPKFAKPWYIAANILTLSFTITNWIAGISVTLASHSWKKFIQIIVSSVVILTGLAAFQKIFFPTAALRAIFGTGNQLDFVHFPSSSLHEKLQAFLFHSIVMPSIQKLPSPNGEPFQIMSIQGSVLGSGALWGRVTVFIWMILLGLGLWAIFSIKQHGKFRLALGLTLLGQLGLHSLHGNETFLYSLHYAPLLVVLVSLSTLTRMRPLALTLVLVLVLSAGINNFIQFKVATDFLNLQTPKFHQTLSH
jgi:hypothetical protein